MWTGNERDCEFGVGITPASLMGCVGPFFLVAFFLFLFFFLFLLLLLLLLLLSLLLLVGVNASKRPGAY